MKKILLATILLVFFFCHTAHCGNVVLWFEPVEGGWSCDDADLLCESFDLETAGNYDNTATEVGTAGTINADATHSGTFSCTDKGTEALQATKTSTNDVLFTYFDAGADNTYYTQLYFNSISEGLANGATQTVAALSTNTAFTTICWYLKIKKVDSELFLQLMHYDGTSWRTTDSASISADTWYGVRIFYSYNTGSGGISWAVDYDMDGAFTPITISNDGTTTRQGRYLGFGVIGGGTTTFTNQFDNIKADNDAYPSACD